MHESNQAPQIPEIIDEAADTPFWLPVLGAALLALFALLFVVTQAGGGGPEAGSVPAPSAKEAPQDKRYETGRVGGAQLRARPEEKPQK